MTLLFLIDVYNLAEGVHTCLMGYLHLMIAAFFIYSKHLEVSFDEQIVTTFNIEIKEVQAIFYSCK